MARIGVYRTYNFIDKDPIIDRTRTLLQDEKLINRLRTVADVSGVSVTTLQNWFGGITRKPQHATLAAVATSIGYSMEFVKGAPINLEEELLAAAEWRKKQKAAKARAKAKPKRKAKAKT